MTEVKLKRLLSKRNEAAALVSALIEATDANISVQGPDGNILMTLSQVGQVGEGNPPQGRYPVKCGDNIIGWAVGQGRAELAAALLTHLANREAEKDTLADEILERYRELNLLYNLSERLAASLEVAVVAQTALDEARRLIRATVGCVMLLDEGQGTLDTVAAFGLDFQSKPRTEPARDIIQRAIAGAKGELVNEIQGGVQYGYGQGERSTALTSLVCAPLKTKNRVIGVIALGVEDSGVVYAAADLKLLNTVASQTAPAVENALLYEKTLREAREREERLQQQVEDLRIELDEARQAKQVAEITESDYFRQLRYQADNLREIIEKP
ncbi:MAG TPA: GAF domain-containing protein [Chloroflexia bacterium]|nr:GAF domain-containing protein [Chloroflexia bacterium]